MFSAELSVKIKEVEQRIKKLESLLKLRAEFDELAEEFSDEIKSINKEITPLFDASSSAEKKFNQLSKTDANIIATMSGMRTVLSKMDSKASQMEKAWDVTTLKKIVDGMAVLSKTLAALEKKSSDTNRKLERTNNGIIAIARHASDIEAEHADAKYAADELAKKAENLRDTMEHFFKQVDAVDNKLNANATALSDLATAVESFKGRIESLESQNTIISDLSTQLQQQSQTVDQLTKRLAYLEKATVKTIVLD